MDTDVAITCPTSFSRQVAIMGVVLLFVVGHCYFNRREFNPSFATQRVIMVWRVREDELVSRNASATN